MTVSVEEELVSLKKELSKEKTRLELIAYPMLVAFIILSTYGFYLMNSITASLHQISYSMQESNRIIEVNLTGIAEGFKRQSSSDNEKN